MATKGFSIDYKKKGKILGGKATTSCSAKDENEARKKFQKDHPDCEIIKIKQTWG